MTQPEGVDDVRTPYETVGGKAAVAEAVERLYVRLLDDQRVAHFFDGVDMARLKGHQRALITQLLSGPAGYTGRSLGAAHQGLGIADDDYDVVGGHLIGVLLELGAEASVVRVVEDALEAVRADIVQPTVAGAGT